MSKMLPAELPQEVKDLPDVLLGYQADLMAMTAIHTVVFCEKSRRIGITWGMGAHAVLSAASNRAAKGMNVYYMGYNLEMAREFIKVCADWAKIFDQACDDIEDCVWVDKDEDGKDKNIKAFRIRFASGNEIIALPSSARSLRGMQGLVIIDEAAFHDDLEEVLKAAYALIMWGGKVLVISTHDGKDNVFNQQIQSIKEKRKGFTRHKVVKITFQDALADGLYERICLVTNQEATPEGKIDFKESIYDFYGDGAKEELDVIPSNSGGVYFPSQIVEPCMHDVPVVTLSLDDQFFKKQDHEKKKHIEDWFKDNLEDLLSALNQETNHYFGWDFARHMDLSIFAPMFLEKNTKRNVPFLLELRNVPFTQQELLLKMVIDKLPRFSGGFMDATGNGANTAEKMQEIYGESLIHAIKITVGWYEEALPPYKAAFEDAFILIPRDNDVLQDHRTAQVINGVPQIPRLKGKDGKGRHGDSLVALAGAYWATRQEVHQYGYNPIFPDQSNNQSMNVDDHHSDDTPARSKTFGNNRGAY